MKTLGYRTILLGLIAAWMSTGHGLAVCPCPPENASPEATAASEEPAAKIDANGYATGDWLGYRKTLADAGIQLTASYTTEPAGNPSGGREQGITYLHNIGVGLQLDLDKIVGLPDATFLVTFSERAGRGLTQDKIGNAVSVQQIFGGGQTYRLVQMRFDEHFLDDRIELSLGRLTATSDFLSSPFYCDFVTNGICGQPPAPFFNMPDGITAYPAAFWGAVALGRFTKETYLKIGVYDGDPNHGDDRHGANFALGDNGVLLFAETGYKAANGLLGMPSRYSIGGYYHSGDFPDVAFDPKFRNVFISGRPGQLHPGQHGFYLLFEQMLLRNAGRPDTGLNAFVTFVASPELDRSAMPYFVNGGFVYEGLIPARPNDKTSLGFYSAIYGQHLRDAEHVAGLNGQTSETDLELNHQIQLTKWLYLRPNIQYVIKPNGLTTIDNALVLGVEAGLTF